MAQFLVGVVVGASVVALLVIVVPWTRRLREETGIDPELEARALLGEDPPEPPSPAPEPGHHRDFDPGELRALRDIGKNVGGKRSRRR